MKDYSKDDGIILILAYPEEMVSMIPAWYKKPLEIVGLVKNGKICAGHAAMMLIHKKTKELHYADFGRYITPFGYGRVRSKITDPELVFEYNFEVNENGQMIDKESFLQYIYANPEKTHGGPTMYASFNEHVDYEACRKFIDDLNAEGSIIYDPFKKEASNCSRFVFDSILAGMKDAKAKKKLKKKSLLTPSPLGNVFYGCTGSVYTIKNGILEKSTKNSITNVVKHLFKNGAVHHHEMDFEVPEHFHFLDGIGDTTHIGITSRDKLSEGFIKIARITSSGQQAFDHYFDCQKANINWNEPFKFIHDCNAAWITVKQNDTKHKIYRAKRIT